MPWPGNAASPWISTGTTAAGSCTSSRALRVVWSARARAGRQLDRLVEHRHHGVEPLDRELLLPEECLVEVVLERLHLGQPLEQAAALVRLAQDGGRDAAHELVVQADGGGLERGVADGLGAERVEARGEVPVHAVRLH